MLGIMLSLLGVAIIVSHGSLATLAHLSVGAGDAWILVGIAIYALYPPLLRRRPVVHPLSLLVAVMGIGSLMMLPFCLREIAAGAPIRGGLASYAAMAYTAVLPSFIASLFLNRAVGIDRRGTGRAILASDTRSGHGSGRALLRRALSPLSCAGRCGGCRWHFPRLTASWNGTTGPP
jgi:hypothetical protein